ncbi:hypothetical protein V8B97DRAFT_1982306 [Scleroderma yunnanense]
MSGRTGLSSPSSKLLETVREDGNDNPQGENRRSKLGTGVSPSSKVQWGESIYPVQKERARAADPNGGACLLTGRKVAIETSHTLARATYHVTQLEWAWGMKKGTLYINTRYNLFLRADWHTLFDKDMWMLIPAADDLDQLDLATARLEEEMRKYRRKVLQGATSDPQGESMPPAKPSFQDVKRREFGNLFNKKEYEYHFVPMPNMEEPICRYSGPNLDKHNEFKFPYNTLGTLKSHIKPHFMAYNAGMKLRSQNSLTVASQIFPQHQVYPDRSTLVTVQLLYFKWTAIVVPEDFADHPDEAEQGSNEDHNNDQESRGKLPRL